MTTHGIHREREYTCAKCQRVCLETPKGGYKRQYCDDCAASKNRELRRYSGSGPLTGDQQALVTEHCDYAERGAKAHYKKSGGRADYDELRSAAFYGLVLAAQRWKQGKGAKFTTFAFNWIDLQLRLAWRRQREAEGFALICEHKKQRLQRIISIVRFPVNIDGESVDFRDAPEHRIW